MSQAPYGRRVVGLHHRSIGVPCGDLSASLVGVSFNRRTHTNRQEAARCDHRCYLFIIVELWFSSGNPTESQLSHCSSHTHPRALHSLGTVDSFRRSFARRTSVLKHTDPSSRQERLSIMLMRRHTRACLNRNTMSVHASALDAVLVSGVLTVARGPTPSRHAGVSVVLWRRCGSTACITRIVVLAWLFLCHAVVKLTWHASTSLR